MFTSFHMFVERAPGISVARPWSRLPVRASVATIATSKLAGSEGMKLLVTAVPEAFVSDALNPLDESKLPLG